MLIRLRGWDMFDRIWSDCNTSGNPQSERMDRVKVLKSFLVVSQACETHFEDTLGSGKFRLLLRALFHFCYPNAQELPSSAPRNDQKPEALEYNLGEGFLFDSPEKGSHCPAGLKG